MGRKGHLIDFLLACLIISYAGGKYPNIKWEDENQRVFSVYFPRYRTKEQLPEHERILKVCISYKIRNC